LASYQPTHQTIIKGADETAVSGSHTIEGTTSYLRICVSHRNDQSDGRDISSVTFGGEAATFLAKETESNGFASSEYWYMLGASLSTATDSFLNPTQILTVNFADTDLDHGVVVVAQNYMDVNQDTPHRTVSTESGSSIGTIPISIESEDGDLVVAHSTVMNQNNFNQVSADLSGQTEDWDDLIQTGSDAVFPVLVQTVFSNGMRREAEGRASATDLSVNITNINSSNREYSMIGVSLIDGEFIRPVADIPIALLTKNTYII
jgi:hypothetical protein